MKKMIFIFLCLLNIFCSYAHPANLTCPPEALIKSVDWIEAKQHSIDPDCWNFISNNFEHAGLTWNVVFGSFFPSAKNTDDALKQARAYFKNATLRNKNPIPAEVSNRIYCDYMSTGEEFWLSAVSPQETIPPS